MKTIRRLTSSHVYMLKRLPFHHNSEWRERVCVLFPAPFSFNLKGYLFRLKGLKRLKKLKIISL
jgi:hypothetical protein